VAVLDESVNLAGTRQQTDGTIALVLMIAREGRMLVIGDDRDCIARLPSLCPLQPLATFRRKISRP
jgi:hypothetical protein